MGPGDHATPARDHTQDHSITQSTFYLADLAVKKKTDNDVMHSDFGFTTVRFVSVGCAVVLSSVGRRPTQGPTRLGRGDSRDFLQFAGNRFLLAMWNGPRGMSFLSHSTFFFSFQMLTTFQPTVPRGARARVCVIHLVFSSFDFARECGVAVQYCTPSSGVLCIHRYGLVTFFLPSSPLSFFRLRPVAPFCKCSCLAIT
jgi:hypothetical protein